MRPPLAQFSVQSLGDLATNLPEELLLGPVWALSVSLKRTTDLSDRPRSLFEFPNCPSRAVSKKGLSFLAAGGHSSFWS